MTVETDELLRLALDARRNSLASFSGFRVGAALETASGAIVTGCNIESASYGLTICAERVAIFKALSEGHRQFTRLAVAADSRTPAPPCGACRQVIWEFCGDIEVVTVGAAGEVIRHRMASLLPFPFDQTSLGRDAGRED